MSDKTSVILKYSNNVITLKLSQTADFKDIATTVCHKFADNRKFFGSNELILSIEGRTLSDEEEKALIDAIQLNSDVRISFVRAEEQMKVNHINEEAEKARKRDLLKTAMVIKGSISKGREYSFDNGIIIMGDVKEGAQVRAKGNIIVFGDIAGHVYAGDPDMKNAFIACTSFSADTATIGGVTEPVTIDSKWSKRKTTEGSMNFGITLFDGHLIAEPIKTGILKRI